MKTEEQKAIVTVPEVGKDIRSIFQDSKQNFWFAANGEGVFKFDGKTLTHYTEEQGLLCNFVWYIRESEDGKLWFVTRDGVSSFDGERFATVKGIPGGSNMRDIKNDLLLLGYSYDGKNLKNIDPIPATLDKSAQDVRNSYAIYYSYRDSKGSIWVGTQDKGVAKYDGKSLVWLGDEELNVAVRCIYEDKQGNIWIGNNGYGLFRYDGKRLTNFTKEHKLDNPDFLNKMEGKVGTLARVWTINSDRKGNLWIGTIDSGLWKYDGSKLTNYTVDDGLSSNAIWTIHFDEKGLMWIGTEGGGLMTYDGKAFKPFDLKQ